MDLQSYRDFFPITAEYAYLNSAAMSPLPTPVAQAIEQHVHQLQTEPIELLFEDLLQKDQELKERAAQLVGAARPDEIVPVQNTGTGINVAAKSLPLKPGDNVLVLDGDYPAVVYPWLNLAPQGILTKVVPQVNGGLDLDLLKTRIDAHTRVVSVSTAMFATGCRNDIKSLGQLCKARDIYLVVDAIQTLGYLPMDVQAWNVDFLASGSHKWLMSAGGSGILYCRHELMDRLQLGPYVGTGSVVDSFNFLEYNFTLQDNASRFNVGMQNFLGIVSLHASIGLILEAGVERIAERVLKLTSLAMNELQQRGFRVLSPLEEERRSGLVLVDAPNPVETCKALFEQRVVVSPRGQGIRISPNFWNSEEDVCRACEVLSSLR